MSVRRSAVLVGVMFGAVACEGPSRVVAPAPSTGVSRTAARESDAARWTHDRIPLRLRDQCDPTTFNLAVGPGDCVATPFTTRRVTFLAFLGQLEVRHNVRGWFNSPGSLEANPGDVIDAVNRGGEQHTFTRVAKYGGGIVPILNKLSGLPTPAPECLAASPSEFLRPGQTDHEVLPQTPGRYHYMCCIHPWMRTDVVVERGDEEHHTPDADDPS